MTERPADFEYRKWEEVAAFDGYDLVSIADDGAQLVLGFAGEDGGRVWLHWPQVPVLYRVTDETYRSLTREAYENLDLPAFGIEETPCDLGPGLRHMLFGSDPVVDVCSERLPRVCLEDPCVQPDPVEGEEVNPLNGPVPDVPFSVRSVAMAPLSDDFVSVGLQAEDGRAYCLRGWWPMCVEVDRRGGAGPAPVSFPENGTIVRWLAEQRSLALVMPCDIVQFDVGGAPAVRMACDL